MPFPYSPEFLVTAFTYQSYRQHLKESVSIANADEAALKMLPDIANNIALMEVYDESYKLSDGLSNAINASPPATWLVITEAWCGG